MHRSEILRSKNARRKNPRRKMAGRSGLLFLLCLALAPAHAGVTALTYEEQALTLNGERRTVRVPKGYRLELLSLLDGPRMLSFAANGDLFAGSKSGKGYRLRPPHPRPAEVVQW